MTQQGFEIIVGEDGKGVRVSNRVYDRGEWYAHLHFDPDKNILYLSAKPGTFQIVRLLFREDTAYFALAMMQEDAPISEGAEVVWETNMKDPEHHVKYFRRWDGSKFDLETVREVLAERRANEDQDRE